jgi:hypothetical protein
MKQTIATLDILTAVTVVLPLLFFQPFQLGVNYCRSFYLQCCLVKQTRARNSDSPGKLRSSYKEQQQKQRQVRDNNTADKSSCNN